MKAAPYLRKYSRTLMPREEKMLVYFSSFFLYLPSWDSYTLLAKQQCTDPERMRKINGLCFRILMVCMDIYWDWVRVIGNRRRWKETEKCMKIAEECGRLRQNAKEFCLFIFPIEQVKKKHTHTQPTKHVRSDISERSCFYIEIHNPCSRSPVNSSYSAESFWANELVRVEEALRNSTELNKLNVICIHKIYVIY